MPDNDANVPAVRLSAIYRTYNCQEYVAKLEDGSCEWNTFMCCWTSGEGMASTSDVCRVLDYPGEGDVVEMPRDSEGPVDW